MSKIKEIIESGRAPGFVGRGSVDPTSVYALAPKGLAAVESEPIYKHGPARGASRISEYFGMSTKFIKKQWAKPPIVCLLILLAACESSLGSGQLNPGLTFVDGQTVHAADLNNLVANATANPLLISSQPIDNTPVQSDYLLLYSPTLGGTLNRVSLQYLFLNGTSITSLSPGTPNYFNSDLFSFYSASATNNQSITFSNLVLDIASNLNPALINFAPTNNNAGATNLPWLPSQPSQFSGPNTNNQPYTIYWGTNGIPYQVPLSNLEASAARDMGSNYFIPFMFQEVFQPFTLYGTNPVANPWNNNGTNVTFAITNIYIGTNPVPTLTNQDTIPVYATKQATNTTMSLDAINDWLAPARINFNGQAANFTLATNTDNANGLIVSSNNPFSATGVFAVSFLYNVNVNILSNNVYYVVPRSTNLAWMQVFDSYTKASMGLGNITIPGPSSNTTSFYVSNYFTFNADAIVLVNSGGVRSGTYDICFRNPLDTTNYQISALPAFITSGPDTTAGVVLYGSSSASDIIMQSNKFRMQVIGNSGGGVNAKMIQIRVSRP